MRKYLHGAILLALASILLYVIVTEFLWIYTLIAVGSFSLTWLLFVFVFWAKKNQDRIPKWLHKPIIGLAAVGYVLDALVNIFVMPVIFWEWADFKTARVKYLPTVSERLRDILRLRTSIEYRSRRYGVAHWMCRYLIEPYDKNHCGLDNLDL